jgi:hypothetical protein
MHFFFIIFLQIVRFDFFICNLSDSWSLYLRMHLYEWFGLLYSSFNWRIVCCRLSFVHWRTFLNRSRFHFMITNSFSRLLILDIINFSYFLHLFGLTLSKIVGYWKSFWRRRWLFGLLDWLVDEKRNNKIKAIVLISFRFAVLGIHFIIKKNYNLIISKSYR